MLYLNHQAIDPALTHHDDLVTDNIRARIKRLPEKGEFR
jgi:hypothetical protein